MQTLRQSRVESPAACAAFTLMEVMIAGGILFMCLFAILALIANTLSNARALQRLPVDAGILAADAYQSQKLVEGSDSGDFGELYPDFRWTSVTNQVDTNGLFQVDLVVFRRGGDRTVVSHMSILMFRPDSPRGNMMGAR
jgi:Tfp pilus assembly protein PilV